jgi:ergothioneine biosynthesis protein EgtB
MQTQISSAVAPVSTNDISTFYKTLHSKFTKTRQRTLSLCEDLQPEDFVVQPMADVSPTKWHLAHTTWFFETFLLVPYLKNYKVFQEEYNYLFNSYYETVGKRVLRTDRGNLTRPTIKEIYEYRMYVDNSLSLFFEELAGNNDKNNFDSETEAEIKKRLFIGLNHEEQHQELLVTDIKYVLGNNPLFPAVKMPITDFTIFETQKEVENKNDNFIKIKEGIYQIGFQSKNENIETEFYFDNEKGVHRVFVEEFEISKNLVTNREYLEFINAGGYQNFNFWLAEGWDFVKQNDLKAPLYWFKENNQNEIDNNEWFVYNFNNSQNGLQKLDLDAPLCHISFYEAEAYAQFRNMRLPTEHEWEISNEFFEWGKRWEWTRSAYQPYPNFAKDEGALGEYNGKFMINQLVLRGSSEATAPNHSRYSYRNFFHADKRWQYTGIRLVK